MFCILQHSMFSIFTKDLFDIALRKCQNLRLCDCDDDKKVPAHQHAFLLDQRNKRKMTMTKFESNRITPTES